MRTEQESCERTAAFSEGAVSQVGALEWVVALSKVLQALHVEGSENHEHGVFLII